MESRVLGVGVGVCWASWGGFVEGGSRGVLNLAGWG